MYIPIMDMYSCTHIFTCNLYMYYMYMYMYIHMYITQTWGNSNRQSSNSISNSNIQSEDTTLYFITYYTV